MERKIKHFLLTGQPGIGKTTAVIKTCKLLQNKGLRVNGFYTEEVRDSGRNRVGFDVVKLDGSRSVLARKDVPERGGAMRMPLVGQYKVDVQSFENAALSVFQDTDADVLIVDEIGKMELFSKKFEAAVRNAFRSRATIVATIPVPKGKPLQLVEELRNHPECRVITVSRENREAIPEQITEAIMNKRVKLT